MSDWVVSVIDSIGATGVGLLMALENVFPPVPSEVVLPFAGFSASRGSLSLLLAWVAATLGALAGAYVLYGVGRLVGYERLHALASRRWFVLFSVRDLARGERFFDDHGGKVVLLGRFLPFFRSVVSVPAGAARMPLLRFSVLTALGSGVWNALFLGLGYGLGDRWETARQYVAPVSWAVGAAVALAVVVQVVRHLRRSRQEAAQA